MLVADERTAERFALDAGDVERLYYGFSVLHCLPVGRVGEDAAGTGTVMREGTVRGYAEQAGFAACEVAPIENDFWRFCLADAVAVPQPARARGGLPAALPLSPPRKRASPSSRRNPPGTDDQRS